MTPTATADLAVGAAGGVGGVEADGIRWVDEKEHACVRTCTLSFQYILYSLLSTRGIKRWFVLCLRAVARRRKCQPLGAALSWEVHLRPNWTARQVSTRQGRPARTKL